MLIVFFFYKKSFKQEYVFGLTNVFQKQGLACLYVESYVRAQGWLLIKK